MRISKQVTPPGGWVYKQGDYLLKEDTRDSLVALVTEHRVSNGIAVGNVVEDIENQLAKNNPSIKLGIKLK